MKLTREETIRKHREMWNWIAERTEVEKRVVGKTEYFESKGYIKQENDYEFIASYIFNNCFYGWGWRCDNEEFKAKYGFDYGTDDCMIYFYLCGAVKALEILSNDSKIKMNDGAKDLILDGIKATKAAYLKNDKLEANNYPNIISYKGKNGAKSKCKNFYVTIQQREYV